MKKLKLLVLITSLFLTSHAYAGWAGSLTINSIYMSGSQVSLSFTTQPPDCWSDYYSYHAYVPVSFARFKDLYAMLLMAKALGKTINIWYTDTGDCSTASNLLNINGVAFN